MLSNKSSLEIILDDDFTGIMYGLPEESLGCKLKGKLVLSNKDSLSVKHLLFIFTGKITVACGPPMSTSRPEYSETQIIYRKEYLFHNSTSSNKKIPAGKHEYSFNFDLPGHLPSSFKGSRGKIEYYCSAHLSRPMFRNNMTSKKIVYLQRCLMDETRAIQSHHTTFTEGSLGLDGKIRYQISTPIMTFREGGLVHVELTLKSTNSDNVIENVEFGLKEQIHYRTTGEQPNAIIANFDQSSYPFGKKQVKIDPNDTSPTTINFRLCPWVNCDVDSQLINVNHKLSFTVCVSKIVNIEDEILNEETNQQSDRRFSVPVSRQAESREERRVRRTTSLIPSIRANAGNTGKAENSGNSRNFRNSRNSRTFSLSTLRNYQKALPITKIEKKRIHFEIPIIVTTKSFKPEHPTPPYNFVDRPPDYAIASMIPPPPEYVPDMPPETAELLLSEYLANGFVAYEEDENF